MLENGSTLSADERKYTILDMVGRGANTVAYLAECEQGNFVTKCILKEYSPHNKDDLEKGKAEFLASARMQNKIRQNNLLNNQTPPVSHIFELNGTAYIDVACYNGTTLDRLTLNLPQYMAICETISKTVGYYHKVGYICLDLKPENIFILQNSPDDTITQLVEFIDFDSLRETNADGQLFSYTREWAAPEQINPYTVGKIGETSDIYTIGEIVFYFLFGRHSCESEHRGFSKYPFDECRAEYGKYTERPDIRSLFTRLFRGTIRSSAANRFKNMSYVTEILGKLAAELNNKEYIVPVLPSVSPNFTGRDREIVKIADALKQKQVYFISGIGGIGKSTLIKNYIARYRMNYDVIVYLEYDGDFIHTFCDDMQLQISTVSRHDGEQPDEYFSRKFIAFKRICADRRVLFVVDNFSGKITKEMSRVTDCGYNVIIASRNLPPKNSFPYMEITAIADLADIFRLITMNLERQLTKDEKSCFEEIIRLVQGHTLVIELIARQIASGRSDVHTALDLIRANGFSRFSHEKIGNYKDGEEVYDTLSAIITAVFDAGNMSDSEKIALKIFSLLNVRGLETSLVQKFFPDIQQYVISDLSMQGWLYADERIRIHPVIAETVQHWEWSADDVDVMEYHQKMIDIYVGMSDDMQIKNILREAEIFKEDHPRHIVNAMYLDMVGWYYDVMLGGAYYPENAREAELLQNMLDTMGMAIAEMELSSDERKTKYLTKYYLSLASILIRSYPEYYDEAAGLLEKLKGMIIENSEDHCYFCMVSAWYYTLAERDIAKTKSFTDQAESIAKQVFATDLELIDIIHIPTANCYYYHNELYLAADELEEAVEICKKYTDMLTFIDKQAELLNCQLDVYFELGDIAKCRELIAKIDYINETYKEQGICHEVSPEIRDKAG